MGETYADVVFRSNGHSATKHLLVDTGATFSWVNTKSLGELGVKSTREMGITTIEGKIITRKLGEVEVECMGRKVHTVVVFAEKDDGEVLGLHALEGLCLEVSPTDRQLKEVKAVKALFSR